MVCRHQVGDPNCSSSPAGRARAVEDSLRYEREQLRKEKEALTAQTPDSKNYTITRVEAVGDTILVLQVQYPNCAKCAYEGTKTLVIIGVKVIDALRWKEIDPHFADPKLKRLATQAPSPAARFPGNADGWNDAIEYARRKLGLGR
jgi:hypothetical protein